MTSTGSVRAEPIPAPSAPTAAQRRKLERLLSDALVNVPFYRELYGGLGLTARDLADPDVLSRLPVLTKADLRDAPLDARRNGRVDPARLSLESTTGSTGMPFSLYVDPAYRRRRNLRFLRALLAAGYRPWHRLMLLTDRYPAPVTQRGSRSYVSVEQSTDAIVEAYRRLRPHFLYGFATPLRLLAEGLAAGGVAAPKPRAVVSTAEALDPLTASGLGAAFGCPVHDFYGLTEMGLVAWKRQGAPHYTPCARGVLTEFLPLPRGDGVHRMVMTNLDLRACPVIRFDTGDLASLEAAGGVTRITSIEGRRIDTILKPDGHEISPYRVTDALRGVSGLERFKVTQHALRELDVDLQVAPGARETAAAHARAILAGLVGEDCKIDVRFRERLVEDGTRKFRPVESRVART